MINYNRREFGTYFPVATCAYGGNVWYNWALNFPEARFAEIALSGSIGPWCLADEVVPTWRTIVVGIPGIPADIAFTWTFGHHRPTSNDVRAALSIKPPPARDPLIFGASA